MDQRHLTDGERIALLEYKHDMRVEELIEINKKLDELLALRHKGIGAFWLASSLFGTSIIGLVTLLWGYFHGHG